MAQDIIFTSIGAPFFAKYLARITNKKYLSFSYVNFYSKKLRNSCLFTIGLYSSNHNFYNSIKHIDKKIILFAGNDIRKLRDNFSASYREKLFSKLLKRGVVFATEAPLVQDKIKNIFKIDSKVIYLPSPHKFPSEIYPFPKKFTMGCYTPKYGAKRDYYHCDLILDVAKKMPDINFHLYSYRGFSNGGMESKMKNIICYPKCISNMPKFLRGISCGLRITDHDTYSMSAIEYNMAGRWFINNHPMPHCDKISHNPSVDEIIGVINEVRVRQGTNVAGKKLYDKTNSLKDFLKNIKK